MSFSEIFNLLLGGTVITLVVALATMKATVRKANAEAEKAKADADKARAEAETVRITNTENATRILVENIVKPLKDELHATREDLQATKREMASTKREMARLRKAVEAASGCPHSDGCPVLARLRVHQKDADRANAESTDCDGPRHGSDIYADSPDGSGAGEPCGDEDIRGQPP